MRITTDEARRCLELLQEAEGLLTAAQIGRELHLAGSRETQRRRVRLIVEQLRSGGARIVATLSGGYWLTADEETWQDYLAGRQIKAKRILGEAHRRGRASREAGRQELLFGVNMFRPLGYAGNAS